MVRFLVRRLVSGFGVVFFTAVFAYGSWRILRADQLAGEGLLTGTWADVRATRWRCASTSWAGRRSCLAQQIAVRSAVLITVTSVIFDLALASRDPRIRASGRPG